ncbi:hypothetical protein GQ600_27049 [Phytophthora cactorum]|nr:hypothetical protein GQ600_27049 [Phytophthora cactorum]
MASESISSRMLRMRAAPSAGGTCQQIAAVGDIKVGIAIVTDTSCATGGIGCISDVCRYCRLVYTQQPAAFINCGVKT